MIAILDYQLASDFTPVPSAQNVQQWADAVLQQQGLQEQEFTLRIVDTEEGQSLNKAYRQKDYPTNVLSFPFEAPPGVEINFLGDLVVCAEVVAREAKEQNKEIMHHWAHMITHGLLHLLGYDHIDPTEADEMEAIECSILKQLGIDDPYQDSQ